MTLYADVPLLIYSLTNSLENLRLVSNCLLVNGMFST